MTIKTNRFSITWQDKYGYTFFTVSFGSRTSTYHVVQTTYYTNYYACLRKSAAIHVCHNTTFVVFGAYAVK